MIQSNNTAVLSQINSPIPPAHLYSRERLLKQLKGDYKLILVCSPAGYGKTTLVLDYLRSSDIKFGWVNISESTEHVFTFFQIIVTSLQKVNPSFGNDTLQLLNSHFEKNKFNSGWKSAINDVVLTFKKDFDDNFNGTTALILDDYHHIENHEWKDYATETLIKNLPESMQLIITSRQVPEIDFSRFVLNDMILKIEMEDLVFSNHEAAELISRKYKIPFNTARFEEIIQNLGGWITGLHLLMQGFGDSFENADIDEQPIPENIFDFLADKIFHNLDEDSRSLLITTGVIENFDEELCISLGIIKFSEIMAELLRNNTFIQVVPLRYKDGSGIVSYNYMRLFRNYLVGKLYSLRTEDEINTILRGTYKHYLDKKDIVTSIKYMIKAGDDQAALEHININFDQMYNEGKIEFLWDWMKSINKDLINSSPAAIINYGILKKFYSGDLTSALEYFDRAIDMLKDTENYALLFRAHTNKARVLRSLGKTSEVIMEFESLVKDPRFAGHLPVLNFHLAYALFHASDYFRAENLLKEIISTADETDEVSLVVDSMRILGHINLIRGNYIKAVSFYELAVIDEKNVLDKFEVLCNLILLSSQSAEYSKAKGYLNELGEIFTRFPTPVFKIPYLLAKQAYLFESGDLENAMVVMTEINETAKTLNHKQYIYLSYRLMTECYYYKKENEKALESYEMSLDFVEKDNILKKNELDVSKALLMKIRGEEEEKIFINAYKYYKENSLTYNLAQICYYMADFYYREDRTEEMNKYLDESLEICIANGYDSFLIREYRFNNALIENNRNNKRQTYIKKIKDKAESKS